jgi:Zn-dependent M28 family amino/carboxypeptidase
MPDPVVQAVVDAVDADRWFADVQTLASWDRSSLGGASLAAARDWIGAQFSAMGLAVEMPPFTIPTTGGPITRNNVVATWHGTVEPDRWIIVGAHYDARNQNAASTVGTPGADDNASGCAGVIELARALLPTRPRKSFLFICYAGEEQGLRGSAAHVQSLTQTGDLARIDSVLIMDMIGYSADANLQALYESSEDYPEYLQRFGIAAQRYVPTLDVLISMQPFGSDHVPYLDAGVQTLLAIEADWDDYPHYHRSTDTPANIGPQARAMGGAILKTNAAVLADIGGAGAGFADDFESAKAGTSR